MYTPAHFLITDRNEILAFMRRFNFATTITSENNKPIATHLPFVIEEENNSIYLYSHFARANPQWESIAGKTVLVIFSQPHAYISPKHYEKELNVPTWNYLSVHAYGEASIISDRKEVVRLLEKMIHFFEASYKNQWDKLPENYKEGLIKGIVAFKIKVGELQGTKKLSQNKTEKEKANIISSFEKSSEENERMISEYMKKENK